MKVDGKHYRTIWIDPRDPAVVLAIDQLRLPHDFQIMELRSVADFVRAIQDMHVRGAGLIGAAAGFGMYSAALSAPGDAPLPFIEQAARELQATRPTAKNLEWALDRQLKILRALDSKAALVEAARQCAQAIADEDAASCRAIGGHGLEIIRAISRAKQGAPVNILTHCNAGWLAFVDYGSATAPIYAAHAEGIPVHVWVDETRPRNQGASLTAWELGRQGVAHDLIVDNAGGHLMQHGMVDMVIVGSDRTTVTGDVANKIGTYLKALAAKDNHIPFYAALPSSTFDWALEDGVAQIPIEERDAREVRFMSGLAADGLTDVLICPPATPARNWGFDVTPARLVTGLITERGLCTADRAAILGLYPEHCRS